MGITAEQALGASRKYTNQSILGISGALAGKNCTIKSIVHDDTAKQSTVTFEWTANDGTVRTTAMNVPDGLNGLDGLDGSDGIGVKSASISATRHLILTLTDDSTIDAGELPSDGGTLTSTLTATQAIGSVTEGKTYPVNTELETVIRDMLTKEESPEITLTLNPIASLYDVVSDTLSTIVLTATVTKHTYAPKTVDYYVDDVKVNTRAITSGGTYSYTHTFSTATNADHTFKVVVNDDKLSSSDSKTIKFVGQTYYGIVASDVGTPTSAQIKALSKTLKDVKEYTWSGITTDFGKVVYAYPKSFGDLISIRDVVNNFTYTDIFTRAVVSIDDIEYNVYVQAVASASDNIQLAFA